VGSSDGGCTALRSWADVFNCGSAEARGTALGASAGGGGSGGARPNGFNCDGGGSGGASPVGGLCAGNLRCGAFRLMLTLWKPGRTFTFESEGWSGAKCKFAFFWREIHSLAQRMEDAPNLKTCWY